MFGEMTSCLFNWSDGERTGEGKSRVMIESSVSAVVGSNEYNQQLMKRFFVDFTTVQWGILGFVR